MPDFRVGAARDLPVRDDAYDRGAAHLHMLDAANIGGEKPDFAQARRGFLIYDAAAPELRGSYHLPFADIVDGKLVAIGNGVRNAASRLPQMNGVGPQLEAQARTVLDGYLEKLRAAKKTDMPMDHAYSLLQIKSVNEDQRVIEGVASTPVLDRGRDRMNPLGAKFTLPLSFLWHHNPREPIGNVEYALPTAKGIQFRARLPFIAEPGPSKTRVDGAWQDLKHGLVRGASIGWNPRPNGAKRNKEGGLDVEEWDWLELSAVTIPMNQEANILSVKSICAEQQAASGQRSSSIQIILPPGVSGLSKPPDRRDLKMTTVSERIATLENLRGQKAARIDEVSQKALTANRTMDDDERKECQTLKGEIEVIDGDLDIFRFQEKGIATTGQPVNPGPAAFKSAIGNSPIRYYPEAKAEKPAPGIRLARVIRCKALARVEQADVARVAEREYGTRDPWLVEYVKAGEVAALSTSNLGDGLIPAEVGLGDFAEFLRPMTITGQFGANGIPGFRRVGFRSGLASVTSGSTAYWVGELKPKPLTAIDSARSHLLPLKIAALLAVSMEDLADSSPSGETAIRDDMAAAVVMARDVTFIDPTVTASAGVSPASITNDQDAIASSGTDSDAVLLDLRSLFAKFDAANNMASQAVLVMSTGNARALSFMQTALGTMQFPTMRVNGGSLNGVPVIASDHAGDTVALISAGDVLYADDGNVRIDMSTEASLEMKDANNLTQHGDPTATGAAMVSMFQINGVAFRAEQRLNWVKRRAVVAPYLTGVAWGEAVNAS
jgi:hypothetical protein